MAGERMAGIIAAASRTGGVDSGAVIAKMTSIKPYRVNIEGQADDLDENFLIPSPFIIELTEKDESKRATSHYHKSGEDWKTSPAEDGHFHEIPPQETDTQLQKPLEVGDKIWMIPVKGSEEYLMLWRDLGGL